MKYNIENKKKEFNTNVLRKDLVNQYQKEMLYNNLIISGTNQDNRECEFLISEKQLFVDDYNINGINMNDQIDINTKNRISGTDITVGINRNDQIDINTLYGFNILRKTIMYCDSFETAVDNKTHIILFNMFNLKTINIPEGVEILEIYGSKLEEITLPQSLKQLTIIKCINLKSIDIPNQVEYLKFSKNGFKNKFNIPDHCSELIVDINSIGEEASLYLNNKYVNLTLVANDEILGN